MAWSASFLKRLPLLREHRQRLIAQRDHLDQVLAAAKQKIGVYERQIADQQAKKEKDSHAGASCEGASTHAPMLANCCCRYDERTIEIASLPEFLLATAPR